MRSMLSGVFFKSFIEWRSLSAGLVRSAGAGRLSIDPSATATRFWKAAAGLKNMCANFDQTTPPNRTALEISSSTRNKADATPAPCCCRNDQISAVRQVASSDRMNRSARTTRCQAFPSEATSTRMKNQNQPPPTTTINAPRCQMNGHTLASIAVG